MIKYTATFLITSALVFSSGCANRNKVIIDPNGVDMGMYQQDLRECKQLAEQVESKAGGQAVGSALVGGAIGAIIGNSDTAEKGAGVGFVSGLAKGAEATEQERLRVIKNCLRNRGYSVLN